MLSNEEKIKAFDLLLQQIEKHIEDDVQDWLDENPYFEVDDEDWNGNRTFRYPPTNSSDAIAALSEDFVNEGSDICFGDFCEFACYLLYGQAMSKNNPYREFCKKQEKTAVPTQKPNLNTIFDDIFKAYNFPTIRKTEGGAK